MIEKELILAKRNLDNMLLLQKYSPDVVNWAFENLIFILQMVSKNLETLDLKC